MEVDYKVPGGKLIRLQADLNGSRIVRVAINGDFFLYPEDRIAKLEKALAGKELDKAALQSIVEKELEGCEMVGISPEEITNALMKLSG
jgi:lipoate-protein ligase A